MGDDGQPEIRPHHDLFGLARNRVTLPGVIGIQLLANSLGVVAVALYVFFLAPLGEETDLNVIVFVSYVAIMVIASLPLNVLALRRAVGWVKQGVRPTRRQRALLFSLPAAETLTALLSWIGAAVIFGLINTDNRRISVGIALAGVVTCTLLYLVMEGYFRPVFALALVDAELPEDRRDVVPRLMLPWLLGSGVPLVAIGLSSFYGPEPLDLDRLRWIAMAAFLAGGAVMGIAARSVSRPVLQVRDAMRELERGDLDVHIPVDDLGELGRLAEGVNNLAAGLREREALRELFNRQVGQPGLADIALDAGGPTLGERVEVTVLFVDLRGYTRFAETSSPEDVVAMLNRFFRVVVAVVNREGGWINKFEGDAALCLFGAPHHDADHAERALRTAAALPRELERVDDMLAAGIGVASGEVLAGFVGTAERFEYTVIGDVVNLAARLCEEAKDAPGGALADTSTISGADRHDEWMPAGTIPIRGRRERARVFGLVEAQRRRSRLYGTIRRTRQ